MKLNDISKVLCVLLLWGCGADKSPSDPTPAAIVSGVVREQGSGAPVVGASVSIGGVSATSGQNGQFELRNVPTGASLSINVTAPGYDALTQGVTVNAGTNTVTLTLVRNGLYAASNYLLYLPSGVATYRGVLVVMFGGTVDTRQLVRGDLNYYQAFPLSGDVAGYRQRMRAFAEANDFAVLGGIFDASPATYSSIFSALANVGTQSGHPELGNAPLLLHGHSARACVAYDFAATHPERIIGFIFAKNYCAFADPARAAGVPAYFFFGQNDSQVSAAAADAVRAVVDQNRARSALWAFAIEPGAGHTQVEDHDVLFNWMSAVVSLRLGPGSGTLRPVAENAGWIGDATSFAIGAYPCFTGNKTTASWLPSEQTASDWQRLNSRGTVTTLLACGSAD